MDKWKQANLSVLSQRTYAGIKQVFPSISYKRKTWSSTKAEQGEPMNLDSNLGPQFH